MAGAGDGVGAHQHTSSLQSFSAIGDGAAEAQLTTPRSRRQVVSRAPRLDCDSDESVLAVTQPLRRDDSDDTITLGTDFTRTSRVTDAKGFTKPDMLGMHALHLDNQA